jgi:hypothetical protein
MARTHKIQKAHQVHKRLADPSLPHPVHAQNAQELHDWMTCGNRHGNKRHAEAGRKVKARKSRRMQEKSQARQEITQNS